MCLIGRIQAQVVVTVIVDLAFEAVILTVCVDGDVEIGGVKALSLRGAARRSVTIPLGQSLVRHS